MSDETHGDAEAELARAFRRGDPEATREVRRRIERIVAFRGYHIPAEERRDLVQESATQIWQAVKSPGFDEGGGFWGLVEVVTARRSIDWLRRRRPETAEVSEARSGADGPLESALARERERLASAALARLGKPCRELIHLHVGLGKPYGELEGVFGKSAGALRVQMLRCIREARRILAELAAANGPDDSEASRS